MSMTEYESHDTINLFRSKIAIKFTKSEANQIFLLGAEKIHDDERRTRNI